MYKELGEDVDRLRNRQEIFKQWIDCERHIPKNIVEYILLKEINTGSKIIYDNVGLNAQILAKINITLFKTLLEVITKVDPQRIKEVHIVSLPKLAQGLYTIGRALLPEKIKQRIILHKDSSTLLDYIKPNDILPNEYGGKDGSWQDLADEAKELLMSDLQFQAEREKWFLVAELPTEKRNKLTFDDQGAAGSFRKLQID